MPAEGSRPMSPELENLVRSYANGEISWSLMRAKGVPDYLTVLGALAELHLDPPKSNLEQQSKARATLQTILRERAK